VRQTIDVIASDDDLVVTRWTTEGTHEGVFQGYAPTGLPVTWSGINLFRIECSRIAEEWSELDGLGRAAQFEANAEQAP
jgi:predicted ester cyclase